MGQRLVSNCAVVHEPAGLSLRPPASVVAPSEHVGERLAPPATEQIRRIARRDLARIASGSQSELQRILLWRLRAVPEPASAR